MLFSVLNAVTAIVRFLFLDLLECIVFNIFNYLFLLIFLAFSVIMARHSQTFYDSPSFSDPRVAM